MNKNGIGTEDYGDSSPGKTVAESMLEGLRKFKEHDPVDKPAQVDAVTGESMSFRELLEKSVQAAEGWKSLGLGVGDMLAVFARNYNDLFPAVLGALFNGCSIAFVTTTSTEAELRHELSLCKPKAMLSESSNLKLSMQVAPDCLHVDLGNDGGSVAGIETYQSLLQRGAGADPDTYRSAPISDRKEHVICILYSSGTTGHPKGVMLSDFGLNELFYRFNTPAFGSGGTRSLHYRLLVSAQLCWPSNIILLAAGSMFGASRYFLRDANDAMNILETIEKYKINFMNAGTPALVEMGYANKIKKCDLSSLKCIRAVGVAMSAEVQKQIQEELGVSICQGYGATEIGMVAGDRLADIHYGSLGRVADWVKYRLVDPDTEQDITTPNTVGEMRIKSPCYMKGYIGNPKATAEAVDEQGYYKTGDLLYFDEEKYFFFVDRCKEIIKYKTQPIAPAEIESLILTHPGVQEVCVVAKEHPQYGELPTGFVVRSPGSSVTEQDLDDLVSSNLADFKRLRGGVIFMDSLPRTHSGKTGRRQLKKLLVSRERIVNVG